MKKVLTIIFIIFLFIIIFSLFGFIIFLVITNKPKKIESIKTLHYSFSNGYSMNAYTVYDLECDEDCYVTVKPHGYPEDRTSKYKISEDKIDELIKVFNDNKVLSWDGYHKNNKYVLDGDSFSFSLTTKEGLSVSASGYMKWPDNYFTVQSAIEKLLSDDRVFEINIR